LRAVLDANVIISASLSPSGTPAHVLRAWLDGRFELIVSPLLLAELERAFAYPKIRRRVPAEDAQAVVDWLRRAATMAIDPGDPPPIRSVDPGDDYLLALAAAEHAVLVSGDDHLLSLAGKVPVYAPVTFMARLDDTQP
jgi:putative PIN family toxin of toxin-antitoxin system